MLSVREEAEAVALANVAGVFKWGPKLPEVGRFVGEAAELHAEKLRKIAEAEEQVERMRADALALRRKVAARIAEHYTREEILAARRLAFP
jgi:hypothetical protein